MVVSKRHDLHSHWNRKTKVVSQDGRVYIGIFKCSDKHMNIVLDECDEFRKIKNKKNSGGGRGGPSEQEVKRTLGFVLMRGTNVVSVQALKPEDETPHVLPVAGVAGLGVGGSIKPMGPLGIPVPLPAGPASSMVPGGVVGGILPPQMMPQNEQFVM